MPPKSLINVNIVSMPKQYRVFLKELYYITELNFKYLLLRECVGTTYNM